jgi:hypothetical protein
MLTFFSSPHILFFKNKEAQKASFYSLGNYKCRTCGFVKRMKLEKIQISEKIREEPEANLIPTRLKTPFKF